MNLSRAALRTSDAINRVAMVKTMSDQEAIRIAPREPSDKWEPFEDDRFTRVVAAELHSRLGPETIVARSVNGQPGLWVGFDIENDRYWLQTELGRVRAADRAAPGSSGSASRCWPRIFGSVAIARLINQPLRELSFAASRIREGEFDSRLDENTLTSEIREVNMGFNRMARELAKVEEDRAVMLAGISHDLRTPLARLRLEAEMSVHDEEAQRNMALDIDQLDAIIDKFMDYARPGDTKLQAGAPGAADRPRDAGLSRPDADPHRAPRGDRPGGDGRRHRARPRVLQPVRERAPLRAQRSTPASRVVHVTYARTGPWVIVSVRDHGPGVAPEKLRQLTTPFFRGDAARTAATGAGLGLAIVEKALAAHGRRARTDNARRRRPGGAHPAEARALSARTPRAAAFSRCRLRAAAGRSRAPRSRGPRPPAPSSRPSWP